MKLTYPRSHKPEDLRPLYEEYRGTFPSEFEEWLRLEKKGSELAIGELADVQKHVFEFLVERAKTDSHMALVFAFLDFRTLIVGDYLGIPDFPRKS